MFHGEESPDQIIHLDPVSLLNYIAEHLLCMFKLIIMVFILFIKSIGIGSPIPRNFSGEEGGREIEL
ncbi:MAG: hypothetical protein COW52_05550 [Nitrospirae bacterium CG17_big_fil_post_rev_8_21_14_2_50_50_9]|nr:MAG: hypothetical protein COW52_05550 [Nitrospirae bacterium CG17_big_fil_post_rev_8_21_14_2_50_50_9]